MGHVQFQETATESDFGQEGSRVPFQRVTQVLNVFNGGDNTTCIILASRVIVLPKCRMSQLSRGELPRPDPSWGER